MIVTSTKVRTATGWSGDPSEVEDLVPLADAATILVDARLGTKFAVTLTANRILGTPSNPPDPGKDRMLLFAIRQDAVGGHTLTLASGYRFGVSLPSISLSAGADKTDYLGVRWNANDGKWDVMAFSAGF